MERSKIRYTRKFVEGHLAGLSVPVETTYPTCELGNYLDEIELDILNGQEREDLTGNIYVITDVEVL